MNYAEAIKTGKERTALAVQLLSDVGGPSFPLLVLKMGLSDFTPVGAENFYAVIKKDKLEAVVLCDIDGNAKAITGWLNAEKVKEVIYKLEQRGIKKFEGRLKTPV